MRSEDGAKALVSVMAVAGLFLWMCHLMAQQVDARGWAGAPTPWPMPTPTPALRMAEAGTLSPPMLSVYPDKIRPYRVKESCARSLLGVYVNQFKSPAERDRWIVRAKRDCPREVAE